MSNHDEKEISDINSVFNSNLNIAITPADENANDDLTEEVDTPERVLINERNYFTRICILVLDLCGKLVRDKFLQLYKAANGADFDPQTYLENEFSTGNIDPSFLPNGNCFKHSNGAIFKVVSVPNPNGKGYSKIIKRNGVQVPMQQDALRLLDSQLVNIRNGIDECDFTVLHAMFKTCRSITSSITVKKAMNDIHKVRNFNYGHLVKARLNKATFDSKANSIKITLNNPTFRAEMNVTDDFLNEVDDVIEGKGKYTDLDNKRYRDRMYKEVMEEHDRNFPDHALDKFIKENWIISEKPKEKPKEKAGGGKGVALDSVFSDENAPGITIIAKCVIGDDDLHLPHMISYETRELTIPIGVSLCVGYKKNLANAVSNTANPSNSTRWLLPLNDSHFNPLDSQDLLPDDPRGSRWHFTIYYCETSSCWKIRRAPDTESIEYGAEENIRLKRSKTVKSTLITENTEVLSESNVIICGRHYFEIVKIKIN